MGRRARKTGTRNGGEKQHKKVHSPGSEVPDRLFTNFYHRFANDFLFDMVAIMFYVMEHFRGRSCQSELGQVLRDSRQSIFQGQELAVHRIS